VIQQLLASTLYRLTEQSTSSALHVANIAGVRVRRFEEPNQARTVREIYASDEELMGDPTPRMIVTSGRSRRATSRVDRRRPGWAARH
jgi:hypothetical protein